MIQKNKWYKATQGDMVALFIFMSLESGNILELVVRNEACTQKFMSLKTLDKFEFEHEIENWQLRNIKPQEIESPELSQALETLKALAGICGNIV